MRVIGRPNLSALGDAALCSGGGECRGHLPGYLRRLGPIPFRRLSRRNAFVPGADQLRWRRESPAGRDPTHRCQLLAAVGQSCFTQQAPRIYSLTGGHFVLGGSEYVATLNAARSSPPRSHLIVTFRDHHATAAAGTPVPPTVPTEFDYKVSDVAANSRIWPTIFYTSGVYDGIGSVLGDQTLVVQSGAISGAEFLGTDGSCFPLVTLRSPQRSTTAAMWMATPSRGMPAWPPDRR